MKKKKEIIRKYVVSFKEMKKALGIKGEIVSSGLWAGLSPAQEEMNVSRDRETIQIVTKEKVS